MLSLRPERPPTKLPAALLQTGLLLLWTLSSCWAVQPVPDAPRPAHATPYAFTHARIPPPPLSRDILRSIFAMRLTVWPDGTRIQVLVLPDDHPLHRRFSKSVLGLFPYQLRQTWDQGVFSGTGEAPLEVHDLETMREELRQTPGAIGYLPAQPLQEGLHRVELP